MKTRNIESSRQSQCVNVISLVPPRTKWVSSFSFFFFLGFSYISLYIFVLCPFSDPRTMNRQRPQGDAEEDERRKRCIVIKNLPELASSDRRYCRAEDYKAACDITRYLGIKTPASLDHVRRMGRPPRRILMVELESIQDVNYFMDRIHFLRHVEDTKNLRIERAKDLNEVRRIAASRDYINYNRFDSR